MIFLRFLTYYLFFLLPGGSEDDCEGVTGRCLNGGICDLQRGRCNCLAGWTGPQCEEPLDQCHGEVR